MIVTADELWCNQVTKQWAFTGFRSGLLQGVQEGAAWALDNLAVDNHANQAAIAGAGAIPPPVRLLGSGSEGVQQHEADALGNLAVNTPANRAAIAAGGGIPPLVRLLGRGSEGVQELAATALAVLAFDNDANRAAIAAAGAIPPLVRLLGSSSAAVQEHAAMALMVLTANDSNRLQTSRLRTLLRALDYKALRHLGCTHVGGGALSSVISHPLILLALCGRCR